ncbi:MAG: phosphatase PAP2 family protein [Clostridium sp.]|uniref:phosphatase PAP2 family protein n=1 Tax=Clostridium sp. TaxID=1506 RepID=UPI003043EA0C
MNFLKKYKGQFVIGIFILLMGVFTFNDLEISQALINKNCVWANIMEKVGEHPAMILGFIGSSILMKLYKPTSLKPKNIIMYGAMACLAFFGAFGLWVMSADRWFGILNTKVMILGVIFAILLIVITQLILKNVKRETLGAYKNAAIVSIICAFLTQLVLQGGLKVIWGRVRPRDLLTDLSNFTPWYLPQGVTGNASFPSGHSFNGWSLILLTLYVKKDNVKLYNFTWIFAVVFGTLVCLSRVIVAAHFPSDVLAGAMIMISSFYVSKRIVYKDSQNIKIDIGVKR